MTKPAMAPRSSTLTDLKDTLRNHPQSNGISPDLAAMVWTKNMTNNHILPTRGNVVLFYFVLDSILELLEGKDLKNLRLCSWTMCWTVSNFLFDSVYFSVNKEDLDAYQGIMGNPHLRGYVKNLHYDVSGYTPELTIEDYVELLAIQLSNMTRLLQTPFNSPDQQLNKFVEASRKSRVSSDKQVARYTGYKFIKRGYEKWMTRANYERSFQRETRFERQGLLNAFIDGISTFESLESVVVHGFWEWDEKLTTQDTLPRQQSGSRVKRSWDPRHLAPYREDYFGEASDRDFTYFDGSFHFDLLNKALSLTGKNIRKFEFKEPLSRTIFAEAGDHELLSRKASSMKLVTGTKGVPYGATQIGFAGGLEVLHLEFEKEGLRSRVRPYFESNYLGLRQSLKAMPNLKTLELWFPEDEFIDYDLWFAQHGEWPNLTTFRFKGVLRAHAHQLAELFLFSMPELRHLSVGSIDLLTGTWQGMLELLMLKGRLQSFAFYPESHFYPGSDDGAREEYDFLGYFLWSEVETGDLRGAMKYYFADYLVRGTQYNLIRHPCLEPMDPVYESSAYLLQLAKEWQFNHAGPETKADRQLKEYIRDIDTIRRYDNRIEEDL